MSPKIAVIGLKGLPAIGGAAAAGQNIIDQLDREFDFTIYSLSNYIGEKETSKKYKQIIFKSKRTSGANTLIYYIKSAFHALFFGNYDLIHLHHAESGFILPILKLRYKVVVTFHGTFDKTDPKFGWLTNRFFKFSEYLNLKFADRVTTVSSGNIEYLISKGGNDIRYIPNGVNLIHMDEVKHPKTIVFAASRIYSIKGLHTLVEALNKIKFDGELIVIGSFDHEVGYKQRIDSLINSITVTYTGLISEKDKLFKTISSCELFVFPSVYEAMSMMLLEVVGLRIPVIASNIEANKIVFSPNELSFFNVEDNDDLSQKIIEFYSNPELAHEKAKRALKKVAEEYTWNRIGKMYGSLFEELIGVE